MDKYDTKQAVDYALNAQPVDFANAINAILADKLQDAVTAQREATATHMFGPRQEVEDEESVANEPAPEENNDAVEEDNTPSEEE